MRRRVLALAQIAPALGDLAQNLALHEVKIAESKAAGADLVIFPELSLTGYQLQDLAPEVAMRRTDPRLDSLARLTSGGPSAVVSFVESTDDHRLFAAAALLEAGEVRHVARKCYLPTYGLFDERRFLAAGDANAAGQLRVGADRGEGLAYQQPARIQLEDPFCPGIDVADAAAAIQQDPADGGGIHPAQQLPGWRQGAV